MAQTSPFQFSTLRKALRERQSETQRLGLGPVIRFTSPTTMGDYGPQWMGNNRRAQLQAVLGDAWDVNALPPMIQDSALRMLESHGAAGALDFVKRNVRPAYR